jgi:hypothetical protein
MGSQIVRSLLADRAGLKPSHSSAEAHDAIAQIPRPAVLPSKTVGQLYDDHADETPRLANAAERKVYQALLEQLQSNDRVIPGQRVTDHLKDHEVDCVVAIEGAGIACLEVKGGDVWHDGETWWQKRRGHEHKIKPVRQAREACYALREFIEKDDHGPNGGCAGIISSFSRCRDRC